MMKMIEYVFSRTFPCSSEIKCWIVLAKLDSGE